MIIRRKEKSKKKKKKKNLTERLEVLDVGHKIETSRVGQ